MSKLTLLTLKQSIYSYLKFVTLYNLYHHKMFALVESKL